MTDFKLQLVEKTVYSSTSGMRHLVHLAYPTGHRVIADCSILDDPEKMLSKALVELRDKVTNDRPIE